jgi:uncharacterized membrane protein (DUF4010 family)
MPPTEFLSELRFALALALGFLIGLERERSGATKQSRVFAGVRTFTLISLFGFACAWLHNLGLTAAVPVGLVAIAGLAALEYYAKLRENRIGWTTEAAVLLTYAIGALALLAPPWVPLALGIIGTLLLSEKSRLEGLVESLDSAEFLAVLKFLIVTALILPVVPDRAFTQFAINPHKLWLIVVMVSSVGFAGYFMIKKLGTKFGWWLSGLAGGIVSSTAVSVAAGRIAQQQPGQAHHALQAALLASSVMYLRILVLVAFLNGAFVPALAWKLGVLCAAGFVLAWLVRPLAEPGARGPASTMQNPFEIVPALMFALLFVVLMVATKLVQAHFGDSALLGLAAVIGVVDIDPFILSLVQSNPEPQRLFVSAILVAMMVNTLAKGVYFSTLARSIRRPALGRFALWAALHLPLAFLF